MEKNTGKESIPGPVDPHTKGSVKGYELNSHHITHVAHHAHDPDVHLHAV